MLCLGLLLCSLLTRLQGLEILDPHEVEYLHLQATGTLGGSVTLDCGSTLPTIYIWAYSGAGPEDSVALAYDYGQGAKLQPRAHRHARMSVPLNSSALTLEELQAEARGTYTCQALYDKEDGARITFYITQLDMED
ncbi:hypothetical protein NHX12_008934 [Muraenolepis orangiensis]|uniref:Ig-like domain-containing protein n=1 Tax=Muraenolepis orangiensis TaxID=630683 RepID=A0A9Q0DNT0_9TELE|nr:hypothetical protein NHX12_008934 [Muraenolepis orangiensis]